jgi:hypothetical protein
MLLSAKADIAGLSSKMPPCAISFAHMLLLIQYSRL